MHTEQLPAAASTRRTGDGFYCEEATGNAVTGYQECVKQDKNNNFLHFIWTKQQLKECLL